MTPRRGKGWTVAATLGAIAAMVALVAASVPLYDLFCRVTGYGGTPQVSAAVSDAMSERSVTVRFDATVMRDLPWNFRPAQRQMTVHLGENVLAFYTAENNSDRPVAGHATFNVTPAKAGRYFNKIECFCFTEQLLLPGESKEFPVSFFVDPSISEDDDGKDVTAITLSYTFFNKGRPALEAYLRAHKSAVSAFDAVGAVRR